MLYSDGNEARAGDTVAIDDKYRGIVVAAIDANEYSDGYSAEQWAYLREGILVDTDFGGLVHYPSTEYEKLSLISRR
jgi:hypothetical protein